MQPFGMRSRSANFPGDPLFEVLNASLVHSFYHPGDGCASLSLAIHPLKDVWDFTPLGRMPKASLCNRWVSGNRIQFFKNLCGFCSEGFFCPLEEEKIQVYFDIKPLTLRHPLTDLGGSGQHHGGD